MTARRTMNPPSRRDTSKSHPATTFYPIKAKGGNRASAKAGDQAPDLAAFIDKVEAEFHIIEAKVDSLLQRKGDLMADRQTALEALDASRQQFRQRFHILRHPEPATDRAKLDLAIVAWRELQDELQRFLEA